MLRVKMVNVDKTKLRKNDRYPYFWTIRQKEGNGCHTNDMDTKGPSLSQFCG